MREHLRCGNLASHSVTALQRYSVTASSGQRWVHGICRAGHSDSPHECAKCQPDRCSLEATALGPVFGHKWMCLGARSLTNRPFATPSEAAPCRDSRAPRSGSRRSAPRVFAGGGSKPLSGALLPKLRFSARCVGRVSGLWGVTLGLVPVYIFRAISNFAPWSGENANRHLCDHSR
jgi:hypothetical protein